MNLPPRDPGIRSYLAVSMLNGLTLDEIERDVILGRMATLGHRKPEVARSLGISLKTLYSRLNAYRDRDEATASLHHYHPPEART